ncbi:MAG: GAF domain-containing protein [Planctomycetes bacterium]|nr:GAF domain-containing protein [Planctomycetota bacterium]
MPRAQGDFGRESDETRSIEAEDRPILLSDAAEQTGAESAVKFALRSVLCVPIRSRGVVAGGIYVENRTRRAHFAGIHATLLSELAEQAGIAIEASVGRQREIV